MSQSYQDARRLLTPEVKEALDSYIDERRRRIVFFGTAGLASVVISIAAFVFLAYDAMQKTARDAAIDEVRQAVVQDMAKRNFRNN